MGVEPRWIGAGLIGASVAGLLLAGGLSVAERHDPNCALCHLPPEEAFVGRAVNTPVDVASRHAQAASGHIACVDCHGGAGLAGRIDSLRMGGNDLWHWLRGDYTVLGTLYLPADSQRFPVAEATCRGCHTETLQASGFENHFHQLMDDPHRPTEVQCTGCHAGHKVATPAVAGGISVGVARQCEACHVVMGGPVGLVRSPTTTPAPVR